MYFMSLFITLFLSQLGKRSFTWTLNPEEIQKRLFCLRYSTTRDCYYRLSSNQPDEYRPAIKGWQNGIYGCMNIQRFYCVKRNGQSLVNHCLIFIWNEIQMFIYNFNVCLQSFNPSQGIIIKWQCMRQIGNFQKNICSHKLAQLCVEQDEHFYCVVYRAPILRTSSSTI